MCVCVCVSPRQRDKLISVVLNPTRILEMLRELLNDTEASASFPHTLISLVLSWA